MRMNCMVIGAEQMLKIMEPSATGSARRNFKSPRFDREGVFRYQEYVEGVWHFRERMPNECAEGICMPLWEVVGIDNGGFDDYALMFFENDPYGLHTSGKSRPDLLKLYTQYISENNIADMRDGLSAAFLHWLEDRVVIKD